jgi:RNA polymerase sigma-70 factor (ECF subfamily)
VSQSLAEGRVDLNTPLLEDFLMSIERRSFAMARAAIGDHDDALDILQETMAELVSRYRHHRPQEWRPLFYRILNSKIHDAYRRRTRHRSLFDLWSRKDQDNGLDQHLDQLPGPDSENPARKVQGLMNMAALRAAISALPRRQREAFLLRCWEGLSTADTARSMKCSEGSVKTHYSRALASLRTQLEDFHP